MKTLKRIVRILDKVTDACLFLIFFLFFLMGLYALYDSYLVYMNANDTSLLKYKPGYESDADTDKKITDDMVAWLTLDDTNVDYPVMQGEDNNEYLNKDPFGDYSLSGSIFLDSRNASDFSDSYSLIYGHHMEHEMMFGALDAYLDEDYFRSHQTGSLSVGGKDDVENRVTYQIRLFAVVESEGTQEAIFAPTEHDDKTLQYVKQHALYFSDSVEVSEDTKLIALSTCKYPDTADRTIVFGILVP